MRREDKFLILGQIKKRGTPNKRYPPKTILWKKSGEYRTRTDDPLRARQVL